MTYIMPQMKQSRYNAIMKTLQLLLTVLAVLLLPASAPAACNVCHSKNLKMQHMHSALGYKDCFTCHGPTATLMDRNKRSEDLRCMICHKV